MGSKLKAQKRKEKLKNRKNQAFNADIQHRNQLETALVDLCAEVLPEYANDSNGIGLFGRKIVYQMGMIAWNAALSGKTTVTDQYLRSTNLDEPERQMIRTEVEGLIRKKHEIFPHILTIIGGIAVTLKNGSAGIKVIPGNEFVPPPMEQSQEPQRSHELPLNEQITTLRKQLRLSQVKFGEQLGVSVKTVSVWEHGKSQPPDTVANKIIGMYPDADIVRSLFLPQKNITSDHPGNSSAGVGVD